ncbi:CBS domain-containing protein, partial [Acinetobacter baumannii]
MDGIVTERDLSHPLAAHGKDVHEMPVSALMSSGVVTCSPDASILSGATTMTERHLRHLPVKQGRRLAGIVS